MIGGIPSDRWIGRQVFLRPTSRSRDKRSTGSPRMCPAVVVAVDGDNITVRPTGHRNTTVVISDHIKPWWAKNPDLKKLSRTSASSRRA